MCRKCVSMWNFDMRFVRISFRCVIYRRCNLVALNSGWKIRIHERGEWPKWNERMYITGILRRYRLRKCRVPSVWVTLWFRTLFRTLAHACFHFMLLFKRYFEIDLRQIAITYISKQTISIIIYSFNYMRGVWCCIPHHKIIVVFPHHENYFIICYYNLLLDMLIQYTHILSSFLFIYLKIILSHALHIHIPIFFLSRMRS